MSGREKPVLARAAAALNAYGYRALMQFRRYEARRQQRRFIDTYVAVTGSCGKSTTTALTGALLAQFGSTEVGLHKNHRMQMLRTARKIKAPVDFVVQETSGHAPGALLLTTETLRIDVAVVTTVGRDHGSSFRVEGMDIPSAIAVEKGTLVEAVRPGGFACLNADDPLVAAMSARTRERVIRYGRAEDADVRAINVDARLPGRLSFDLVVDEVSLPVKTQFVGTLMLTNVLAALAVVHGLGLDLAKAVEALAGFEPVSQRLAVHDGRDGKTYILDTRKASHWSTVMLVNDLPNLGTRRITFVLGEMSDLGQESGKKYRQVLRRLSELVDEVIATGRSANYVPLLHQQGHTNIVAAPTALDVSRYLDTRPPGMVILKSNKTLQLWRVLDQVTAADGSVDA